MNRRWRSILLGIGLAVSVRVAEALPGPPAGQIPAPPAVATNLMPPVLPTTSPVAVFRHLLDLSFKEREAFLTNRPPEIRAALRAKIAEYLAMDPNERELRLRATELRWQLIPLLRIAPADRGPRLAVVPEDLAPLVKSRLAEWDKLPASLQQEFLANDRTRLYFALVDATNQSAANDPAEIQRQKIASQFNQFFDLTPEEKQSVLKTLSGTERAQMEGTLRAFDKLPPLQRIECVRAFTKFAGLSPAERAEFLKNAEHWSKMSPQERKTWRDLVARVPTWPPLPRRLLPPPPPHLPIPVNHAAVATN